MRSAEWVWMPNHLSLNERAVYAALTVWRDQKTGQAWPSIKTLSAQTGMSESTVKRAVNDLIGHGLIDRRIRRDPGTKRNYSNLYIVRVYESVPDHLAVPDEDETQGSERPTDREVYRSERPTDEGLEVTVNPPPGHSDPTPRSHRPGNPIYRTPSNEPPVVARARDTTQGGEVVVLTQRDAKRNDNFRWGYLQSLGRAEWDEYLPEFQRVYGRDPYTSELSSHPSRTFFHEAMAELRNMPTKAHAS